MKQDDNSNYFLIYVNHPVISDKEKHVEFFDNNSVINVWGINVKMGYLEQKFDLGPDEIEEQRHQIFETVLTQLVNDIPLLNIAGLGNIKDEVARNKPIKTLRAEIDVKGREVIVEREIWVNLEFGNEGDRLYNLACHSLMYFLKLSDNRKKLKRCPYCKKFFIAKDAKRKICYSINCGRESKRLQKQKQRRDNPVKYT